VAFAELKPMAEYLIQFDDGFLVGSFRRHRALQPSRMAFNVVKVCAAVLLAVACLSSAAQGWVGMALLWASLIAVLVMSHRIDYWLMCRRFRHSPYRGETVRMAVEPEGVHSVAGTHDARFQWSAYTRAIGLADGIMLYQGPSVFQWLPDAALVSGNRRDVEQVIRAHVQSRGLGEPTDAADSR
jgi:hypothetical protein